MAEKSHKKTFEFRMSKKVAELTQVVHMLFTRNHEKEVEVEALKDAYEHEISLVLEDARRKICHLEWTISNLDKRLLEEKKKVGTHVEVELKKKEEEWKRKEHALEKQLQEERKECQKLRDLLIQAQQDVESLRQGVTEQISSKSEVISNKDNEIEKLKKQITSLERGLKEQESLSEDNAREYDRTTEQLTNEIAQLQELLEETHRVKGSLTAKNRQLEADLKTLRKDFGKKVSEIVSSQNTSIHSVGPMNVSSSHLDYNDELEKLRREVQKYRMELSNRDRNFNRMFTEKQPIVVDPRAGKIGISQIHAVTPQRILATPPMTVRDKRYSLATSQTYEDDRMTSRSISSAASSSRFPNLPPSERRGKMSALLKPRPLSKQMLFSKM